MIHTHKQLSKKEIEHFASLAKIHLTDTEITKLQLQLNDILLYVEKLNEIPTAHIKGTTHTIELSNILEKDDSKHGTCLENLTGLHIKHGKKMYFSVSKMLTP